jgi:hypothetical protein
MSLSAFCALQYLSGGVANGQRTMAMRNDHGKNWTSDCAMRSRLGAAVFAAALFGAACLRPAEGRDTRNAGDQDHAWSALATPGQILAEKVALRLSNDPLIGSAQADLRRVLLNYPPASMDGGPELLDSALRQWTVALLMREQAAADPDNPQILWEFDDTPRDWFGIAFPGGSGVGDNPDHIYRVAFLNGSARYEISGRLSNAPPVLFSFEAVLGEPGMKLDQAPQPGSVDVGNQVAMLNERDIKVEPDGTFRIAVGGANAPSANSLSTRPGAVEVIMRDVLSDWNQRPNHLKIRRIGPPPSAKPMNESDIARRTAEELSTYVRFWLDAQKRWIGDLKDNTVRGPSQRAGGWGFIAIARYKLGPGQALIATIDPHGFRYTGLHITDPWSIVPDGRKHQTSLNDAQAAFDSDGMISCVIAAEDPGAANWIDTAGLHEGFVIMRWQGGVPDVKAERLIPRFEVVEASQIGAAGLGGMAQISPAQRRAQIARRAADYGKRLSD